MKLGRISASKFEELRSIAHATEKADRKAKPQPKNQKKRDRA